MYFKQGCACTFCVGSNTILGLRMPKAYNKTHQSSNNPNSNSVSSAALQIKSKQRIHPFQDSETDAIYDFIIDLFLTFESLIFNVHSNCLGPSYTDLTV